MRPSTQRLWLVTLLLLVGVPLLYPIWLGVASAFVADDGSFTLFHVLNVFSDPVNREGLTNAFLIACCTTTISVVIALPLALLSARTTFPCKPLLSTLILAPLILPPFVGAIGMRQLLGREGAFNALLLDLHAISEPIDFLGRGGFALIVLLEAVALYPILYLNLVAAIANLDPAMEEAATNLGASRWRRFRTVTLPLIRPGLFAGGTIVFVWSFTELGTPLMLEFSKTTPVQIFNGIKEMEASRAPYALTAVMLAASILSYTIGRLILGGKGHAMLAKASAGTGLMKLTGAILAFCFAMLEVSDSLILAQRESDYPITKAIFTLAERLGDGPGVASALGVWAMAFLGIALATAAALVGKKAGAIFRG